MNVLVLSEISDVSTDNVIHQLNKMGHSVFRINSEDIIQGISIQLSNSNIKIALTVRDKVIDLDDFERVWYRRGSLSFSTQLDFSIKIKDELMDPIKYNLINEELFTIKEFVEHTLREKTPLKGLNERSANKLIALQKAKEAGLSIPSSIVSTEKKELIDFFHISNQNCISKGVQDILSFAIKNKGYAYATSKIENQDLEEMNDSFFPSLLQHNIEKKYELRVFYLDKQFYSMAIFSQNDEQTKVDFRNYNWDKPNRNVPFLLPEGIKQKLIQFMESMNLKTGSIDLIVTKDQRYVFLEVNPVGQYGMVSIPCNYDLDYKIAKEITR